MSELGTLVCGMTTGQGRAEQGRAGQDRTGAKGRVLLGTSVRERHRGGGMLRSSLAGSGGWGDETRGLQSGIFG